MLSEHEIGLIQQAFAHSLEVGAPGLSELMRTAIVTSAMRRIRHQLNVPAPKLTPSG